MSSHSSHIDSNSPRAILSSSEPSEVPTEPLPDGHPDKLSLEEVYVLAILVLLHIDGRATMATELGPSDTQEPQRPGDDVDVKQDAHPPRAASLRTIQRDFTSFTVPPPLGRPNAVPTNRIEVFALPPTKEGTPTVAYLGPDRGTTTAAEAGRSSHASPLGEEESYSHDEDKSTSSLDVDGPSSILVPARQGWTVAPMGHQWATGVPRPLVLPAGYPLPWQDIGFYHAPPRPYSATDVDPIPSIPVPATASAPMPTYVHGTQGYHLPPEFATSTASPQGHPTQGAPSFSRKRKQFDIENAPPLDVAPSLISGSTDSDSGETETVTCYWAGCGQDFQISCRNDLADHLKGPAHDLCLKGSHRVFCQWEGCTSRSHNRVVLSDGQQDIKGQLCDEKPPVGVVGPGGVIRQPAQMQADNLLRHVYGHVYRFPCPAYGCNLLYRRADAATRHFQEKHLGRKEKKTRIK